MLILQDSDKEHSNYSLHNHSSERWDTENGNQYDNGCEVMAKVEVEIYLLDLTLESQQPDIDAKILIKSNDVIIFYVTSNWK